MVRLSNGKRRGPFLSRLARILIGYLKRLMQGNLLIKAVCLSIVLGLVLSCSSKKSTIAIKEGEKEVSRTARLNLIRQVTTHQLNFTTFSGRAKSKITVNRDRYDVTANVRI